MPKVSVDNLEISYAVSRRNVRYPRLEFRTGKLVVVMPKGKKSAEDVINQHKAWVKQKKLEMGAALNHSTGRKLAERSVSELKEIVFGKVEIFGKEYGFAIKHIFFRKMNSKWASHSRKGNITINSALRLLPTPLIEYVVFHEMAHSIERKHNERFWKIVGKKFQNHQKMEEELMIYWFLMHKRRAFNR